MTEEKIGEHPVPRPRASLTSRAVWLALAKGTAYALNLAVPLILVRQMTKAEYGTYGQAFQIVTTAVALLPLGFGMTAFYFFPREPKARGLVVKNILLVNLAIGVLALGVFGFFPAVASAMVDNDVIGTHGALIGVVILLWLCSGFLETVLLANEEAFLAPAMVVGSQVTRTALLLTAAVLSPDLRTLLLASIAHGVLQSVALWWYLRDRFPGFWRGFDPSLLRRQLTYAAPYSFSTLLWVLQTDLHAFFVSVRFGEEAFAIYRVGCFQLPFLALLGEAINAVMIPRVSQLAQTGSLTEIRALVGRVIRQMSAFALPAYTVLLVLNHEFIVGLFGEAYAESTGIFVIYLTLLPTGVLLLDSVVRAFPELGHFIFRFRTVVMVVLTASLLLSTRAFGLIGVTVTIVIIALAERSVVAVRILRTIGMSRRDLGFLGDLRKIVVASAVAGVVAGLVKLLMSAMPPLVTLVAGGVLFGLAYVVMILWLRLPTPDELAWIRRVLARGRPVRQAS